MVSRIAFQADVDLGDETRSSTAFNRVEPALMRLRDKEVMQTNLDVMSVAATVPGSAPKILALRREAVRLGDYDPTYMDQLEDCAYALLHAQSVYFATVQPDGNLPALNLEAVQSRDRFRAEIEHLCISGLIDLAILKDYTGLTGFRRVAADLALLVGAFKKNWPVLENKTPRTLAELDRAEALVNRIIRLVGLREHAHEDAVRWSDLRDRAFTVLVRSYDEARRAIIFLRWQRGDADSIAPSLYAGRAKRKHDRRRVGSGEPHQVSSVVPAGPPNPEIGPGGPFMPATTPGSETAQLAGPGPNPFVQ